MWSVGSVSVTVWVINVSFGGVVGSVSVGSGVGSVAVASAVWPAVRSVGGVTVCSVAVGNAVGGVPVGSVVGGLSVRGDPSVVGSVSVGGAAGGVVGQQCVGLRWGWRCVGWRCGWRCVGRQCGRQLDVHRVCVISPRGCVCVACFARLRVVGRLHVSPSLYGVHLVVCPPVGCVPVISGCWVWRDSFILPGSVPVGSV